MKYPIVQKVSRYNFKLVEDFNAGGVTVPSGFVTDGASVPRLFWSFFNPAGELFEAAIVHDYLYAGRIGTKKQADRLFYEIAKQYRARRAYLAYLAVKLGGRW